MNTYYPPLTREMQAVVLAVQTYRKWLIYDNEVHGYEKTSEQLWSDLENYFFSLPLPVGMQNNNACFEAALYYPIEQTFDTPMEELPKKFTFGY